MLCAWHAQSCSAVVAPHGEKAEGEELKFPMAVSITICPWTCFMLGNLYPCCPLSNYLCNTENEIMVNKMLSLFCNCQLTNVSILCYVNVFGYQMFPAVLLLDALYTSPFGMSTYEFSLLIRNCIA